VRSLLRQAPPWGILWGGSASIAVLFGIFRLMPVPEPEDHDRFRMLFRMLPKSIERPASMFLSLLIHPESGSVV